MEKTTNPAHFINFEEYWATLSPIQAEALEALRQTIKAAAPNAEEVISYNMPAFRHHGMLVYFAAFKKHYSLFAGSSALTASMADELGTHLKSKGTISFSYNEPMPKELITKIVLARIAQNEEKASQKSKK